jgi:hypothetical protein
MRQTGRFFGEFRLPYVSPIVKPNRPPFRTTLCIAAGGCVYPRKLHPSLLPGQRVLCGFALIIAAFSVRTSA